MNTIEAEDFLDNVLKAMWPDWKPTHWQVKKWKQTLEICDFEASKRAIENWYAEADRPGREPVLGVFNKIKCLRSGFKRSEPEPELLFAIAPLSNLNKKTNFFDVKRPADSVIEEMAEWNRKRAERLYGGDWVVLRLWESPPKPEYDGPWGQEAKDAVEKMFLDGPDCKEKRWLQRVGMDLSGGGLKTVDEAIKVDVNARRQLLRKQISNMPKVEKCTFCGRTDHLEVETETGYLICPGCTKGREPGQEG